MLYVINSLTCVLTSSLRLFILVPTASLSLNNTFPPCASPCDAFRLLPFSALLPAFISPCWGRKKAKYGRVRPLSSPTAPCPLPTPAPTPEQLPPAAGAGAQHRALATIQRGHRPSPLHTPGLPWPFSQLHRVGGLWQPPAMHMGPLHLSSPAPPPGSGYNMRRTAGAWKRGHAGCHIDGSKRCSAVLALLSPESCLPHWERPCVKTPRAFVPPSHTAPKGDSHGSAKPPGCPPPHPLPV